MEELKEYTIPFIGLKAGAHQFKFQIGQEFFEHFEYEDFNDSQIELVVGMIKKLTMLEFDLDFEGKANVNCDLTNEIFDLPVSGSHQFVVKFGHEFDDHNEDLMIIPHGSHEVNIQQQVYETIVLSLPSRRIHPGVKDGSLKSEILDKLNELSLGNQTGDDSDDTDPRWDDLKKLLTDK
ncbi:DNA-binding protein [Aureitalea marina]|uniref:DNA-binding protein n=2 Tax=Aureitalea marina TaxID=930804 RepID=A0A2S7KU60_9FLAO|nr:DUF177 domain-containing protein [Aureitalea marina]PQB06063.1 DNA-binding protein [Aureitalea marina]